MKQKTSCVLLVITVLLFGCARQSDNNGEKETQGNAHTASIHPFEDFKRVHELLAEIAEKPEKITVASDKKTVVKGSKGTIIHVDPKLLETIDGSPIGKTIDIELLELTRKSDFLFHNTQTVSNDDILITGGAYYINMTSNGKQLRMKERQGLEVEFPKLSDEEMGLFLGVRDSAGLMNWIPAEQNFEPKPSTDIGQSEIRSNQKQQEPYGCTFHLSIPHQQNFRLYWQDAGGAVTLHEMMRKRYTPSPKLLDYLIKNRSHYIAFRFNIDTINRKIINVKAHPDNPTDIDSKEIIKVLNEMPELTYQNLKHAGLAFSQTHYELHVHLSQELINAVRKTASQEKQKQMNHHQETYKAIRLMNFGWINCDRFYNDPRPKTDIQIVVNDDSISHAIIFAVFKDINSIITKHYSKVWGQSVSINNIPAGTTLHILALSYTNETPMIFEKTINSAIEKVVNASFVTTTQDHINAAIKSTN